MKSCGNLDVKITRPWNNHSFFAAFLKEPPGPPWPFAVSRVNLFFSWSCAVWTMMKIILLISPHVTWTEWRGTTEGLKHEINKMRFWDLLYTNFMLIDEIFVSKIRKWRKVKHFFTSGCTCWKGSSMEQKCSFEGYYWKDFPIATLSQSLHQLATKLSFFFKQITIVGLALKPRIVSKGLASQSFRKCVFGTCTVAMFILFHSILFFNSSQLLLKAFPQSTDLST